MAGPVTSIKDFLDHLKKSNLLSEKQLAEVKSFAGSDADPAAVGRQLIKNGLLTRWQASRLLAGHHTFFVGSYRLLKRLGGGDSAAVFKAEQTGTKRAVALKLLPRELLDDDEAVERFRREVRATASLKHPHVVAAYDAGQLGDIHYLIMEYAGGRDLTAWIEKYTKLPVAWSCEVGRQIADALQHVHEAGLVHRDISPANILVISNEDGTPEAKILDFGRARYIADGKENKDRLTVFGQQLGTEDYMAPEQMRNSREADIRSDIYGLGATLYHMLTGQVPHDYEDAGQKLTALFSKEPEPVSKLRPNVPRELSDIIAQMLEINPVDRYQEPSEVAAALAPFSLGSQEVLTSAGDEEVESAPPVTEEAAEVEMSWTYSPEAEAEEESQQFAGLEPAQQEPNTNVYDFLARLAAQANG